MAASSVEIVQLPSAGLQRVTALAEIIWPVAFDGLIPAPEIPKIVEQIYAQAQLEADMDNGHIFWIAQVDGKDAAFCAAYREEGTVWLKKLYVV